MQDSGNHLRTFSSARAFRAWLGARERGLYQKKLRANEEAWSFFRAQAPWYQRTSIFRVMEGKREETRLRRLDQLIERSVRGEAITQLAGKPLPRAGSP